MQKAKMTSNVALNVRCWGKKLIFALKQICKMSWANLNLVTSDSNVMLGKRFFMAMMLSIKEFCLHFIFKLYWFYPNDWNAWYDLCVIKSLLFFTMLMVASINRASVCLHMFTNPLVMASKYWIAPIFFISFTPGEMTFWFLFYFTAVRRVEGWWEICKIRIHKTPRIHSRQVLQMCSNLSFSFIWKLSYNTMRIKTDTSQ